MHTINVTGPNPLGMANGEYKAEDVNAGEMLARGWCTATAEAWDDCCGGFNPELDWNDKTVLFVRPGGFGDLLFLTPTFTELKRRWRDIGIHVACFERFKGALQNNPDVDRIVRYPVPITDWNGVDAHVWLENVIEGGADALSTHAVDLIAKRTGLKEPLPDRLMKFYLTDEERTAAIEEFPRRDGLPRIGFQMSASNICRMYQHMQKVSELIWNKHGAEIFLFGRPGEKQSNEFPLSDPASGAPAGLINLMMRPSRSGGIGKDFRESCAILSTCDVLVAPDSALTHVAGALGIPCVALYGPFPWTLRTKYAPATFSIQGIGACSPCFHHVRPGTGEFPEHGPCNQTGRCEVLAAIEPERVVREVIKKLERPALRSTKVYATA